MLVGRSVRTTPTCCAITGASAALAAVGDSVQKTIAGVRVGLVDGQVRRSTRPSSSAKQSKLDPRRRRQQATASVDGRGRREGSDRGAGGRGARKRRTRRSSRSSPTIDDLAKEAGKPKLKVQKKEIGHDFYREVEEKVLVPLTEAMRIRGKLENYDRVDQVLGRSRRVAPRGRSRAQGRGEADLQGPRRRKCCAKRC